MFLTGKTHVVLGTAAAIALTLKYPQGLNLIGMNISPAIALLTVSAGSYGPDIDIQQSHLGQQHRIISKHLKHRGITHTMFVPAILLNVMLLAKDLPFLVSFIFGFLLGWLTHIFADLFNKKGVPLLWPFTSKKFHIASFKTRTWHEAVFTVIWLGGLVLWLKL